MLRLLDAAADVAIADAARARGLLTRPLSRYYLRHDPRGGGRRGLLLGYACVEGGDIEPAFLVLVDCLREFIEPIEPSEKRLRSQIGVEIGVE